MKSILKENVMESIPNIVPVLHEYVKKKKLVEDLTRELKQEKDFLGGLMRQIEKLPENQRCDDFLEVIESPGSKSTSINMDRFESLYPEDLELIRNTLTKEAMEKITISFPLGRTEAFLGKGKYLKIIDVSEGEPTLKVVERKTF